MRISGAAPPKGPAKKLLPLLCCWTLFPSGFGAKASLKPSEPATGSRDEDPSPGTLQFVGARTGLDAGRWHDIMTLMNRAEPDHWNCITYSGYCEDTNDQPAYPFAIGGASADGGRDTHPDGPEVFKAYDPAKAAGNASLEAALRRLGMNGKLTGSILCIKDSETVVCGKIKGLQPDRAWRPAIWPTFYKVYMGYSVGQARPRGFTSALTIGSLVDTAGNQPASGASGTLPGLLARSGSRTNEGTFLKGFHAKRTLLGMGQMNLRNVDGEIAHVAANWQMK
uniref:Chitosanase n=1 Tax=Heyndrickxia coagulans TaxID=1398 RepID=Q7M0I1_HEYCO